MIGLTIIFFALFGMVLFPNVQKNFNGPINERFGRYLEIMWQIFVDITTDDTDIIQDNRNDNLLYYSYFLVFTVLTVYFLSNLLTAVVYDGYQRESEEESLEEKQLIFGIMSCAWERIDSQDKRFITKEEFICLLQRMRTYVQFRWILNPQSYDLFFWILDSNSNQLISEEEFSRLLTILHIKFDLYYNNNFIKLWFPKFAQTKFYQQLTKFVQPENQQDIHKITKFDICVISALALVTIFSVINIVFTLVLGKISLISLIFEIIVFLIFFIEALIRISVFGWKQYWSESKFEFFVMLIQFVPCVLFFSNIGKEYEINTIISSQQPFSLDFLIRYFYAFQIPGILRFFRVIVLFIPLVKLVFITFIRMIRASYKLVYVLFSFIYLLSVLGTQILGSIEIPDHIKNNNNDNNNNIKQMNNITNTFIIFLDVLYSNIITHTAIGYKSSTNSGWVWIFFIVSYLILVFICLNLVVSYTIQIFVMEIQRHNRRFGGTPLQKLEFQGSYVYFSRDLISNDIDPNVYMVRAQIQGYTSASFDRVKIVHDIFEEKINQSFDIDDLQP